MDYVNTVTFHAYTPKNTKKNIKGKIPKKRQKEKYQKEEKRPFSGPPRF